MEVFERNLEGILKDLKSLDFDTRKQAIRDLAVSEHEGKVHILSDMLFIEQDIQLKYEIRKTINELESLVEDLVTTRPPDDKRLKNLIRAFQSTDEEVINKAFNCAVENRYDDFLVDMLMIENYSKDAYHRCKIIQLMHLGKENYFKYILEYLEDDDPRVISTAIEALEAIGNTTALASIARLTNHPHNRVRATAIKALHNLGDERAFQLFVKMIQSPYSAYRDSAAFSLAQLNIVQGVQLLSFLLVDEVESVRIKALNGLEKMAELGIEEAKETVQRITIENPHGLWADKLIEKMQAGMDNKMIESEVEVQGTDSRALAALYSDANELRMAAIQKLSEDESVEENANMIFERLKLEKDYKVIASALCALGRARGDREKRIRVLDSYLTHHNDRVRANAIEALIIITEPRDRMFLVKSLKDTSNRVVGNAIVALWDTFNKKSEKALDDLVQSPHKVCQLTAIYCIGELADWKLAQRCKVLLTSKYGEVSAKMESALEHLQDISAFARVLEEHRKGQSDLTDLED